jgi:hypothetical protein
MFDPHLLSHPEFPELRAARDAVREAEGDASSDAWLLAAASQRLFLARRSWLAAADPVEPDATRCPWCDRAA